MRQLSWWNLVQKKKGRWEKAKSLWRSWEKDKSRERTKYYDEIDMKKLIVPKSESSSTDNSNPQFKVQEALCVCISLNILFSMVINPKNNTWTVGMNSKRAGE